MKIFVKAFSGILLVSVLVISVTACSGKKGSGSGNGNSVNKKVTLTMSRWAGPHADDQKVIVQDYPVSHPNIEVVMDDIDFSNCKQKQLLSLQSPVGEYDLLFVFNSWTDEYVLNNYLLPLDDYIKRAGIDMSIYNQSFVEKETYNGKLYALPTFPGVELLVYNKEWLDRDGKSIPKTVDELISLAKFYKQQGTGIALPARQGNASYEIFAQFMFSAGGDFLDPNTGRLLLDSEPARYAANVWDQLSQAAITGSLTWHVDEASQAIREAKAPFGFGISGLAMLDGDPDQSAIVGKAVYTPVPARNKMVSTVSFFGWGIAANTAHPQEAFDFVSWLVSPATEKKFSLMNAQSSCVTNNADDPEIVNKYPFSQAVKEAMADVKTLPTTVNATKMFERLEGGLSEIATRHTSPDAVLAAIQAEFNGVDMRQ